MLRPRTYRLLQQPLPYLQVLTRPTLFALLLCLQLSLLPAPVALADDRQTGNRESTLRELAAIPYTIEYEARYRGFKASGQGTLEALDDGLYRMRTLIDLRFFGQSLTSIDEQSDFRLNGDSVVPERYHFDQSGLGSRYREQRFDHASGKVQVQRDDETLQVSIPGDMLLDELSAIFYLRSRLALGDRDISFPVLDGRHVETHRYRVTDTTTVDNELGAFEALKVERIREPDSKRATTLWFAVDHDYLLVKLEQVDPKDRRLELIMTGATINGDPI